MVENDWIEMQDGEEDQEIAAGHGSFFFVKLVIAVMLFAGFVVMDIWELKVRYISTEEVVREIERDYMLESSKEAEQDK